MKKSIHSSRTHRNSHRKLGENQIVFERHWIGYLECKWQPVDKPEPSIAFDPSVVELAQENPALMVRTYDPRNFLTYIVRITHIKEYGIKVGNGSVVLLPLRYWDVYDVDGCIRAGEQFGPKGLH